MFMDPTMLHTSDLVILRPTLSSLIVTGTSVLAVKFQDGVVIAAANLGRFASSGQTFTNATNVSLFSHSVYIFTLFPKTPTPLVSLLEPHPVSAHLATCLATYFVLEPADTAPPLPPRPSTSGFSSKRGE